MYLPDVNVWVAIAFPAHIHHASARAWFNGSPANRPRHFCRFTESGFLRLANNPKVLALAAVTQDQAWKLYDGIMSDPRVGFAAEPPTIESLWRQFAQSPQFAPNGWTDAYLAAFAVAGNYELVTFDKGFTRYAGLAVTILK
jgi:toxin-antitoxin system PIN domain toxin